MVGAEEWEEGPGASNRKGGLFGMPSRTGDGCKGSKDRYTLLARRAVEAVSLYQGAYPTDRITRGSREHLDLHR